jgi:hypothetical protein
MTDQAEELEVQVMETRDRTLTTRVDIEATSNDPKY